MHSTTNETPFKLLFGRENNQFRDWKSTRNENETAEIINRAIEIKQLLEETHVSTKLRIQDKQVVQKETQDNQNTQVSEKDVLRVGDIVYHLNPTQTLVRSKMTPKYIGPYEVVGKTSFDNYIVKDSKTKAVVPTSIPRQKLHKVKSSAVSEIISHQRVGAGTKFLVRDKTTSKEKWFKSKELESSKIAEYFKRIERPKVTALVRTLLFLIFIPTVSSQELPGSFKVCNTDNMNHVIDQNMKCNKQYQSFLKFDHYQKDVPAFEITIHAYRDYVIDDFATECIKKLKIEERNVSIWNIETSNEKFNYAKLSRNECLQMLEEKTCNCNNVDYNMTCNEHKCFFSNFKRIERKWFESQRTIECECTLHKKKILAERTSSRVAAALNSNCLAKDLKCQLDRSILIWESDIIKNCAYEPITVGKEFKQSGSIMYSDREQLLFQVIDSFIDCGKNFSKTSEGLFISKNDHIVTLDKFHATNKINDIVEMQLAEQDYKHFKINQKEHEAQQLAKYERCLNTQNILRTISLANDRFIKLNDHSGDEVIVYSRDNLLYMPQCTSVSNVTLQTETKYCYKHTPIIFTIIDKKISGYLTNNNIIRTFSSEANCSSINQLIEIENSNKAVLRKGKTAQLIDNYLRKSQVFFSSQNQQDMNFMAHHHAKILAGIDLASSEQDTLEFADINGVLKVLPNYEILPIKNTFVEILEHFYNNAGTYSLLAIIPTVISIIGYFLARRYVMAAIAATICSRSNAQVQPKSHYEDIRDIEADYASLQRRTHSKLQSLGQ